MSQRIKPTRPDYKRIYEDLIKIKFPDKEAKCIRILRKKKLSELDIINLERIIFGKLSHEESSKNKRHRSYDKAVIFKILKHQKIHGLTNTELAVHYGLSRNTVAAWKKRFFRK
ncbi:helix-turn-helix domain-containing protein [Chryseobacterium phocaeense]|uniref:helix-turn-helix domain-containing protein n=1 Tax=Chryseobacterium phocaeense TaxID=1816690 RepID=UPI001E3BA043|nr:helix-turn-helix domain-containing protein [Chryseobacterium phocaeense]